MKKKKIIHFLPVCGCIATGIIYAAIGVIALLSFLKIRHGGADESSMMVILSDYIIGKIFIGIILLGTLCYVAWRFYETIKDPYNYGKDTSGIVKRTGIALSTIADILIVYATTRVLLGSGHYQPDGQPREEREMVSNLLQESYGQWLVIGVGIGYLATAIVQLIYGITRGYRERVNIEHLSKPFRNIVHVLAWAGYFGRGIILGIIGFFFAKAGMEGNAQLVVNTDKAFDFVGDNVGDVYFILLAVATFCYGIFMFVQGLKYDVDKD